MMRIGDGGRYELGELLSEGGFGLVYRAVDVKLSKPVVVKILKQKSGEDDSAERELKREVEALVRIDHRGVVGVLDFGQTPEGKLFLVMQWVDGNTLRKEIKRNFEETSTGLDLERVAFIMKELCEAIGAAHDKKVFHRDLKPENVMLQRVGNDEEQVKVIDFGIARVLGSKVIASAVLTAVKGTLAYIAPEQLRGDKDKKLFAGFDVFALGVIAYELVTGRRPYVGFQSDHALLELQRRGPVGPRQLRTDLSVEAEDAILKALRYEPARRFPGPREFGSTLGAALLQRGAPAAVVVEYDALPPTSPVEVAHVLAVGIEGYAGLLMEQKGSRQTELQRLVQQAPTLQRLGSGRVTRVENPGGLVLAFFGDAVAPAQCAIELRSAADWQIRLKQVVHFGTVYRFPDAKGEQRVDGPAIDEANRVLATAEADEIVVTGRAYETLGQLTEWRPLLKEAGRKKFGDVEMPVYNLNLPERPSADPTPQPIVPRPPRGKRAPRRPAVKVAPPTLPPRPSPHEIAQPEEVPSPPQRPPAVRLPLRPKRQHVVHDKFVPSAAAGSNPVVAGRSLWGDIVRVGRGPALYRLIPLADAPIRLRSEANSLVERPRRAGLAAVREAAQAPEAAAFFVRYEVPEGPTLEEILVGADHSIVTRVAAVARALEILPRFWKSAERGGLLVTAADLVLDRQGEVFVLPHPVAEVPPVALLLEAGPRVAFSLAPEVVRGSGQPGEATDVFAIGAALLRCFYEPDSSTEPQEVLRRSANGSAWDVDRLSARVRPWVLRLDAARAVLALARRLTDPVPSGRPISELPVLARSLAAWAPRLELEAAIRDLMASQRYVEAYALFNEGLAERASDGRAEHPVSNELLLLGGESAVHASRPLDALDLLERAIGLRPDRSEAYAAQLRAVAPIARMEFPVAQLGPIVDKTGLLPKLDALIWRDFNRLPPSEQTEHEATVARWLLTHNGAHSAADFIYPRVFVNQEWRWWKLEMNLVYASALLATHPLNDSEEFLNGLKARIRKGLQNLTLSDADVRPHGSEIAELEVEIYRRRGGSR